VAYDKKKWTICLFGVSMGPIFCPPVPNGALFGSIVGVTPMHLIIVAGSKNVDDDFTISE
jgi:hypothetical protein